MTQQSGVLRSFHNRVKSYLIQTYCKNTQSLLDIGSGRGGDIFKWDKINIQKVIGVDVKQEYINEALNRMSNNETLQNRYYKFILISEHEPKLHEKLKNEIFDSVSCQFSLHYFFKSHDMFESLCENISKSLKDNGYFIATILNGDKVHTLLEKNGKIENECVLIESKYDDKMRNVYGNLIHFYMIGTLYFGDRTISEEYLVYKDVVIETLKKYNLNLICWKSFSTLYDDINFFNKMLTDESKSISFLYDYIVFRKGKST